MTKKKNKKRPGRRPLNLDSEDRIERSRVCARECRVRKKVRYQYLETLVRNKEKSIFSLKNKIKAFRQICKDIERGNVPDSIFTLLRTEDLVHVTIEEGFTDQINDLKTTTDAQMGVCDADFPHVDTHRIPTKAMNCQSPELVSEQPTQSSQQATDQPTASVLQADRSAASGHQTSNQPTVSNQEGPNHQDQSAFSNCEITFFGLLIPELQKLLDTKPGEKNDGEKLQEDSSINDKSDHIYTKSNVQSESMNWDVGKCDTESPAPEDIDTPILDWIVENGSLFESDKSETEESEKEQTFDGTESAEDSNGFNKMGVNDYIHFLTSLSKVNSSQKLDKPFEEEFMDTLNRSPTNEVEKHLNDERKTPSHKAKADGDNTNVGNETKTNQIVECELGQGEGHNFTREVIQHSKQKLKQSISVQERKSDNEEKQNIQRFNSVDNMSEGESRKQDKFPFLAFLLNNKDA